MRCWSNFGVTTGRRQRRNYSNFGNHFRRKVLGGNALKLPMRVEEEVGDEWGVCWVGFREIDGYMQKYKGFVRRRSVVRAR